jgi:hypothetical protein
VECAFKSAQKLNHDILDLLNEPKLPGHCGFPLANLQSKVMLDIVPDENIGKDSGACQESCVLDEAIFYKPNSEKSPC